MLKFNYVFGTKLGVRGLA